MQMDFLQYLLFAYSQGLTDVSADMLLGDMALDTPLPSIFMVMSVALFAAASTPQVSRECWKLRRDGLMWQEMKSLAASSDHVTRDREWLKFYRMRFSSFQYLLAELRPFIENPSSDFVREPVDTEKAVAIVIHRLACGTSPRALAEMYDTGASTVTKYTKLITSILASSSQLYSKYVVIPSGNALTKVIRKFASLSGTPNVCGAIGGSHIKLYNKPKPAYTPADYLSSYGFYSVLLQGVCDSDKIFWDVCCNAPGGLDDVTHLRASSLWRRLINREVLAQPTMNLQGRPLQPFIVADRPYPLMPFLVTPFHYDRDDTVSENVFDMQLLKARECIANAFGLLKARWKILRNMNTDLRYVAQAVMACCVLHNFCQLAGEPEPETQADDYPNNKMAAPPLTNEHEVGLQNEAVEYRRALFLDWLRRQHEEAELEKRRASQMARPGYS
ncbi:protein ANTAGONIST OF LIKE HETEROCHROMATIN PROTEIN 1-like [Selaginella moellendorffii]|uniref:protein ANTAGONIST OF LIKE HETEROCHROMATIN PROTEIN 1-like n=1 Tax=Selaginella moellendorffii TaxID=88036 RepID=UPI000D1C4D5B|nr:protein ANTAGONIST OF LIKE HETEROCHROMATIN PROTEIN 1-like [Selaginella moellendorffii]|eukprot:XP_024520164.1 protein ANTAGONIST OF LIKE HETEROCHROMATIN PROTEIN 1-like [Selaginella moellendorffii]